MSELEKESLEAHVDLCSERYNGLHRELKNLSSRMDKFEATLMELRDMILSMKADRNKQLITWGTALIAGLATACGTLFFMLLNQ
jgi:chromosome segregation ATPase|tara:strand:- start:128 stop:382 length:255 start_codon:yes stop_codon:yes gene_type:complete